MEHLEIGQTYISEDGNSVWVSVEETKMVTWSSSLGWVISPPLPGISLVHDLPTGAITRTWCTTTGCWEDLSKRFFDHSSFRDTTKRVYKNKRNGGSIEGGVEDPVQYWMLHRMFKMSIKLNYDD